MTDYHEQADRMIRGGNVSADAASITYAILALAQAIGGGDCWDWERPVITPNIKGDML